MDHSLEDILSFTRQTMPETAAHHQSRNFRVICSTSVKGDLVQSLFIFWLHFTHPGPQLSSAMIISFLAWSWFLIRWNFNLMWPVLLSWLLVVQLPNYSPQSLVSCKSLCISYAFDARYLLSGIHKCQVHTGLNSFPGFSRRPTWRAVAHHPLSGKSAGNEIAVETRRYSPS